MQAAKDSFFRALQTRLAAVNPARTIEVDGMTRPAIVVVENEAYPPSKLYFQTFYLHWLGAPAVRAFRKTLGLRYELTGQIEYFLQGTASKRRPFADRGRLLAAMDREVKQILFPGFTEKMNHTVTPPASLGSVLHWGWPPDFRTTTDAEGAVLRRVVAVSVSFYPEPIPN